MKKEKTPERLSQNFIKQNSIKKESGENHILSKRIIKTNKKDEMQNIFIPIIGQKIENDYDDLSKSINKNRDCLIRRKSLMKKLKPNTRKVTDINSILYNNYGIIEKELGKVHYTSDFKGNLIIIKNKIPIFPTQLKNVK